MIKDMEIPNCCGECPLVIKQKDMYGLSVFYCNKTEEMVDEKEIDEKCPLIEIEQDSDCVSREQALMQLTGVNLSDMTPLELIALFDKRIKALPPVTPTQAVVGKINRGKVTFIGKGESDNG